MKTPTKGGSRPRIPTGGGGIGKFRAYGLWPYRSSWSVDGEYVPEVTASPKSTPGVDIGFQVLNHNENEKRALT